jgi:hypothetical protein
LSDSHPESLPKSLAKSITEPVTKFLGNSFGEPLSEPVAGGHTVSRHRELFALALSRQEAYLPWSSP